MKKAKPVVEVKITDDNAEKVKIISEEVKNPEENETAGFEIGDIVRLTDDAHYSIDGRGIPEKFYGVDLVVVGFGVAPEILKVQVNGENTDAIYVGHLFFVPSNK